MPFAFSSVVRTAVGPFLSAGQVCPPRWEQPAPRSILSRKACKGISALMHCVVNDCLRTLSRMNSMANENVFVDLAAFTESQMIHRYITMPDMPTQNIQYTRKQRETVATIVTACQYYADLDTES